MHPNGTRPQMRARISSCAKDLRKKCLDKREIDGREMSFFVNASKEETFRLVMDYFTRRHMKILSSKSPSYVKARFGSWASVSLENAVGVVETNIAEKGAGSYLDLYFSFRGEYLGVLIGTMALVIIQCVFVWAQTLAQRGDFLLGMMWSTLIVSIFLVLSGTIVAYSTSKTRRRIIEEFNMFIQSFASKKD